MVERRTEGMGMGMGYRVWGMRYGVWGMGYGVADATRVTSAGVLQCGGVWCGAVWMWVWMWVWSSGLVPFTCT